MFRIKLLDSAVEDLWDISSFISLDNPFQAKIVLENLSKSISYLSYFPFMWKEIKNWYRQIVEQNYKFKIIYKIQEETIYIISIFKYKTNF